MPLEACSASLQLPVESGLSSHHCSTITWEVQLSLWQRLHLLSAPPAVTHHTQVMPCSHQRPQGSAQSVGHNLPAAPGHGRLYSPVIMGLTAAKDMVGSAQVLEFRALREFWRVATNISRTAQDSVKIRSQALLSLTSHLTPEASGLPHGNISHRKCFSSLHLTKGRAEWGGSSRRACGKNSPLPVPMHCSLAALLSPPCSSLCSILSCFTRLCPDLLTFLHLLPSNAQENSPSPASPAESKTGRKSRHKMQDELLGFWPKWARNLPVCSC